MSWTNPSTSFISASISAFSRFQFSAIQAHEIRSAPSTVSETLTVPLTSRKGEDGERLNAGVNAPGREIHDGLGAVHVAASARAVLVLAVAAGAVDNDGDVARDLSTTMSVQCRLVGDERHSNLELLDFRHGGGAVAAGGVGAHGAVLDGVKLGMSSTSAREAAAHPHCERVCHPSASSGRQHLARTSTRDASSSPRHARPAAIGLSGELAAHNPGANRAAAGGVYLRHLPRARASVG
ncbi:unnamed protein product [Phytophthora lilii]|uniref:Unnamed protein product n=1 Tax=Phytophthora lilii TaxID=2077276 RepID=A0A9W6UAN2_9STRA|nr:unnamed protein product [Phytophthora lilii]